MRIAAWWIIITIIIFDSYFGRILNLSDRHTSLECDVGCAGQEELQKNTTHSAHDVTTRFHGHRRRNNARVPNHWQSLFCGKIIRKSCKGYTHIIEINLLGTKKTKRRIILCRPLSLSFALLKQPNKWSGCWNYAPSGVPNLTFVLKLLVIEGHNFSGIAWNRHTRARVPTARRCQHIVCH